MSPFTALKKLSPFHFTILLLMLSSRSNNKGLKVYTSILGVTKCDICGINLTACGYSSIFSPVALLPNAGQGLLILEVS